MKKERFFCFRMTKLSGFRFMFCKYFIMCLQHCLASVFKVFVICEYICFICFIFNDMSLYASWQSWFDFNVFLIYYFFSSKFFITLNIYICSFCVLSRIKSGICCLNVCTREHMYIHLICKNSL